MENEKRPTPSPRPLETNPDAQVGTGQAEGYEPIQNAKVVKSVGGYWEGFTRQATTTPCTKPRYGKGLAG